MKASKVVQICNSRNVLSVLKIKEHSCKVGLWLVRESTIAKIIPAVKSLTQDIKLATVTNEY